MNAATQNEMERLVRVNREQQTLLEQIYQYVDKKGLAKLGQSRVKALIEAHKRAEAERDVLAAHLERLQRALKATMVTGWSDPAEEALVEVFADSPQASLARLKAQWQAEALEELLQNTSQFREANPVRGLADKLRQQGEGGES